MRLFPEDGPPGSGTETLAGPRPACPVSSRLVSPWLLLRRLQLKSHEQSCLAGFVTLSSLEDFTDSDLEVET